MFAVHALRGRGRALVAAKPVAEGSALLACSPMAAVLKGPAPWHTTSSGARGQCHPCEECFAPTTRRFCSDACKERHGLRGGELLRRVDLSPLERLHTEQGRKFPLLVAQLLAQLIEQLKSGRTPTTTWAPLELCFAVLDEEALPQAESEHAALLSAFASAGIADVSTLQMFLPLERYCRLLGAAQLNAFELVTRWGLVISALLPRRLP